MPNLYNYKKNVCLALDLEFNQYIDFDVTRPDSENWIPFKLSLDVDGKNYQFNEDGPCFTVWEVKKIINGFKNIVKIMKSNVQRDIYKERFEPFEHICYEVYFEIKVFDVASDELEVELWLNMAYIKPSGYKMGVRFNVLIDEFSDFVEGFEVQFKDILSRV